MARLLKLVIKTPSQKVADQTIECLSQMQVLALKQLLTEIYPSRPSVKEQRLIYSGHLLNDSSTLEDIFGTAEESTESQPDTYTLHLVCNPKTNSSEPVSRTAAAAVSSSAANANQINSSNNNESNATSNTSSSSASVSTANISSLNNIQLPFTAVPLMDAQQINQQMAQQMYLMQQAYVQQMAQYFQNWQISNMNVTNQSSSGETTTSITTTSPMGNFAPMIPGMPFIGSAPGLAPYPMFTVQLQPNEQQINTGVQQQQQPAQQQRPIAGFPGPEVANAAPGPAAAAVNAGNDVENVDVLDQMYGVVQALILLMLFYLYSSIGRLIFIALIFCGVRAFRRWMQRRRTAQSQQPPVNIVPAADLGAQRMQNMMDQRVEEMIEGLRRRNPAEENVAVNNNNGQTSASPPSEPQISKIRFIWLAVSSLFTSLMPENPAPVNLN